METGSPLTTDFPVTIGGKDFTLSFPIPAIWAYEELTGEDLTSGRDKRTKAERLAAEAEKSSKQRLEDTGDLLWAGLITHHSDVKREDVSPMLLALNYRQYADLSALLMKAFAASLPQRDEAEGSDPLATTSAVN